MQMISAAAVCARHLRDRLVGSDPGLTRLHTAASSALAMASALGVELLVARARGADAQGTLVAMLLGAVVAMMGSMALAGTGVWPKLRTAAFFPVAIGLGMVAGIATAAHTKVMLFAFVAVMFVAVFVRRFGFAFFFYGFMLWMGYFFASFLGASWSMLPWLVVDSVVGSVWVLLLAVTVLRTNPRRTLWRVRRSFGARARRMALALTALLESDTDDERARARARRRLQSIHAQLAEAALIIEAWSGEEGSLPPGWSAQALRRRVLDTQLALDGIALGGEVLVNAPTRLRQTAASVPRALSLHRNAAALVHAEELERGLALEPPGRTSRGGRLLVESTREYVDIVENPDRPPEVEPAEFSPIVSLAMGNLPGSVAVARDVAARGGRWNPLSRLDFVSRQAVQVAVAGGLAIVLGRWLNETRYYWAVIAAFIAFTGTGSRAETFLKAGNRVLGTVVGLVAGIELAHVTQGHPRWILTTIVLSMFCGFYLLRINYAYMIFFVTIMVAQLYTVLHEFSDQLLVLRLEETIIGAAAGIAVALLVTPLSTRDTVRQAQRDVLEALAALLDRLAGHLPEDDEEPSDPEALVRDAENQLRELSLVATPLTRPLLLANDPAKARHRLFLYTQILQASRALVVQSRNRATSEIAPELDALAGDLRELASDPPPLATATAEEDPGTPPGGDLESAASRTLVRLQRLTRQLHLPGSSPTPPTESPSEPVPLKPPA
jgi:uncharacterized membrane protein YccC